MFNWPKRKSYSIYMLQEVHCSENKIPVWSAEWGYKTLFSCCTSAKGIIKLIPKKDAEPYLIKNWRPISLLNSDYKIAAKAIANRFKHVLPNLIDSDQTGFLKGRFIGETIRLIDGIIKYEAAKNIPGLLLFLDFEISQYADQPIRR